MNAQYISLSALAQRMEIYERMPVPLQKGLQNSVQITLVTNLVCIPILLLVPPTLQPVQPEGFFMPTAGAVNYLFAISRQLSGFLLALNVISLILTGAVLLISAGMTKPVHEPIHWLAGVGAIPSGMSALSVAIMTALFALIVFVTLVIWIVIAAILISLLIGFLNGLGK